MVVYIIKTTQNNASIMNSSAGLLLKEALWTRLEKRRLLDRAICFKLNIGGRRGEVRRRRGGGKDRSRSIRREVEKRRGGEEGEGEEERSVSVE